MMICQSHEFKKQPGTHSSLRKDIFCDDVSIYRLICALFGWNIKQLLLLLHQDFPVFLHVCLEAVMDEGCRDLLDVQSGRRVT